MKIPLLVFALTLPAACKTVSSDSRELSTSSDEMKNPKIFDRDYFRLDQASKFRGLSLSTNSVFGLSENGSVVLSAASTLQGQQVRDERKRELWVLSTLERLTPQSNFMVTPKSEVGVNALLLAPVKKKPEFEMTSFGSCIFSWKIPVLYPRSELAIGHLIVNATVTESSGQNFSPELCRPDLVKLSPDGSLSFSRGTALATGLLDICREEYSEVCELQVESEDGPKGQRKVKLIQIKLLK